MTRPSGASSVAVGVLGEVLLEPELLRHLVDRVELVRRVLVRAEHAEVLSCSPSSRRGGTRRAAGSSRPRPCPGFSTLMPYLRKSGMRRAFFRCPPLACGFDPIRRVPVGAMAFSSGLKPPVVVEQLLRLVAPHPLFELLQPGRVLLARRPSAPGATASPFELVPADLRRAGPALRRAQDDHRPARAERRCRCRGPASARPGCRRRTCRCVAAIAWCIVSGSDPSTKYGVQPVPRKNASISSWRDAGPDGRVVDLVPVEVQDRQDRAVADRVEELVDVPARRQRAGLGLAVADDRRDDQVRVVERGPAGVRQDVAEFAALVDRAGRFRACSGCRSRRGSENCLKNRSSPSSSSLQSG